MVNFGFPRDAACAFELASRFKGAVGYLKEGELQNFCGTSLWFEIFLNNQGEPNYSMPAHLYPFPDTKARAQTALTAFSLQEPAWIERSARDISPEKTPHLFQDEGTSENLQATNPLQEIFTVDSLTQMDEWAFDTLLAEIDADIRQGVNPFAHSREDEVLEIAEAEREAMQHAFTAKNKRRRSSFKRREPVA
jgi:hypothetical protein